MPRPVTTLVFDIGNVLVRWDGPFAAYLPLFGGDAAQTRAFLDATWNTHAIERMDAGESFDQVAGDLAARRPQDRDKIMAFRTLWDSMLPGPIEGTVAILQRAKAMGLRTYALSNWAPDYIPRALERFSFLHWFDGRVMSGLEGCIKPDPKIYRILFDRHAIDPLSALFIDDRPDNIEMGESLGMRGHVFTQAPALRDHLARLGLTL